MTTSRPRHQLMATTGADAVDGAARRQAIVSATATTSISGTATRSARATARGPRHTTTVASSPSAIAHAVCDPFTPGRGTVPTARVSADAAITLFSAIHAKLDT